MKEVLFVTGNTAKVRHAQAVCRSFGITIRQSLFSADEIQGEDAVIIARDKARKAYDNLQEPLVVSDDSWIVPGLRGFPGPYMKSVNDWFTVDDWLHLTNTLTDRRIILRQIAVFQDADGQHVFTRDIEGILVHEKHGSSPWPHCEITSFDGGKTTMAEQHERGEFALEQQKTVWHEFCDWWKQRHTVNH
jgi:inosine/xanthosine triphosphate pyrophosphatase family protein